MLAAVYAVALIQAENYIFQLIYITFLFHHTIGPHATLYMV